MLKPVILLSKKRVLSAYIAFVMVLGLIMIPGTVTVMAATNLAQGKTATQSSTVYGGNASRAVDGNTDGNYGNSSVTHTDSEAQAWWMVDLGSSYNIGDIKIYNRTDACMDRLSDYNIIVLNASSTQVWSNHQTVYPNPSTTVNAEGVTGRYVKIQLTGTNYLSLAEVQVYEYTVNPNLAQGKTATQSSTAYDASASRAVDGNTDGNYGNSSVTHTDSEAQAWWMVDLGSSYNIGDIKIYNRTDACMDRLSNYNIIILDGSSNQVWISHQSTYPDSSISINALGVTGRYIKIQLTGTNYLSLAEVQVYAYDGTAPYLSHASSVIMQRGLVFGCWLNPDINDLSTLPTADEYVGLNFNNPQFNNPPNAIYSSSLMSGANANNTWGITKAPYYNHMDGSEGGPVLTAPTGTDFLNSEQQSHADKLYSIQFGDEENDNQWNPRASLIKAWYDQTRAFHPNVIVNTNQWLGQYSECSLRALCQNTTPDVLTYDRYYYGDSTTSDIDANSTNLSELGKYRKIALEGWDGSGRSPIAFGQYVLGDTGSYFYTESESYVVPFITLAAGGKWISYFLWMYDVNHQYLVNQSREKTAYYYIWSEVAKECRILGNHLVKLTSTDIQIKPGQNRVKNPGVTQENPMPNTNYVQRFTTNPAYYVTDMTVTNLGTKNDGLAGDAIIGYFKPLPGASGFSSTNPKYFMVVNGLTAGGGTGGGTTGASSVTQQKITISFDMGTTGDSTKLKKVSRTDGSIQSVSLTHVSGTTYKLDLTLGGGQGELLFWEDASNKDLALDKSLRASSVESASLNAVNAVDGSISTRWSSNFTNNEWIFVDLGQTYSVSRVKLNWETAYASGYKIQVSSDAVNWTDVFTTTTGNGGIDNISFTPINAVYVRMLGTQRATGYGYSLYSFEVYQD